MVHVLQKLQENGTAHDSICRQVVVPRGDPTLPLYSRPDKKALMMGNPAAATDDGDERRTATNPRRRVIKLYGTIFAELMRYPQIGGIRFGTEKRTIGYVGGLQEAAIGVAASWRCEGKTNGPCRPHCRDHVRVPIDS